MILKKTQTDAPLTSLVIFVLTTAAVPFLIYVLFTVWPDSIERQFVATIAVLLLMAFSVVRRKYEILLPALILLSQFAVSLHSFQLAAPAEMQIFFNDIIIFLIVIVAFERRQGIRLDAMGRLFLIFICWLGVASFFSAHLHRSIVFLLLQMKYLVLYILAYNTELSDSFAKRILYAVLGVVLVQSFIAITQFVHGEWLGLGILGESAESSLHAHFVEGNLRVGGTIGGANGFAGYLGMLLVFLLPFMMTRMTMAVIIAFISGLTAIILALSRAGWLSFLVGGISVVIMMWRSNLVRFSRLMLVGFLGVLIVAGGFAAYSDRIMMRFEDKQAISSAMGRLDQVSLAMNVVQKNWLVGIGPGTTEFFGAWNDKRKYLKNALSGLTMPNQVHNGQIQIWLESGTPGFIVFMAMIAVILVSVARKVPQCSQRSDTATLLAVGGIGAATAVMVHISFGTEFNCQQIFLAFWLILGLARGRIAQERVKAHEKPLGPQGTQGAKGIIG